MTGAAAAASGVAVDPVPGGERRYLRQFDLYRAVAYICVVWQHSILWPVPGGSSVGWSMVMFLHATREVFFALSAFVVCYSQLLRPQPVWRFWYRRIGALLVPYLVWTGIYLIYTVVAKPPMTFAHAMTLLVNDLETGYYQLYFLVVLFQMLVVIPALLWFLRRPRGHHGKILGVSVAFQLAMMTVSHYGLFITGSGWHVVRRLDLDFIMSRDVIGYQLYVVVGALAAMHFGEVQRFVERHWRGMLWVAAATFAALEGLYVLGIEIHQTPGHSSDLYQPAVVVWCLAAIGGLTAAGWAWARRAARRGAPNRVDRVLRWASDASGGYYFAHVLVLQIIFTLVAHAGWTQPTDWGTGSAIIFFGTMVATGALVSLLWRTPLRWVLTGPDRSAERAAWPAYPVLGDLAERRRAVATGPSPTAPTTASAISR